MRIIMKSETTDNQIDIGKRIYPKAEIRRENEVYIAFKYDRFCGVFDSLEMVELQIGKIRQLKPCEQIVSSMECCGITENGVYIFKTKMNVVV